MAVIRCMYAGTQHVNELAEQLRAKLSKESSIVVEPLSEGASVLNVTCASKADEQIVESTPNDMGGWDYKG